MTELQTPAAVSETDRTEQVLATIHESPDPVSVPAIEKLLGRSLRIKRLELEQLLDEAVAAGRLVRYAPYRSRSPRYWDREVEDYAERLICRKLTEQAGKGERQSEWAMTRAALKTAISKQAGQLDKVTFDRVLDRLVSERQVYALPKLPGSGTVRFSTEPPRPEEYLKDAVEKIRKFALQLADCDVPEAETRRAAIQLIEQVLGGQAPDATVRGDLDATLLERLRAIEPASGGGMRLHELRSSVDFQWPHGVEFREVVRNLVDRGQVFVVGGDRDLSDATRLSTRRPAAVAAPAPAATAAPNLASDPEQLVLDGIRELTRERHPQTRRVPIFELREWIARRAGEEAASHRVLDDRLKRLRSAGKIRLLAISDTTGVSGQQLAAAVPGVHETLFYVEAMT